VADVAIVRGCVTVWAGMRTGAGWAIKAVQRVFPPKMG